MNVFFFYEVNYDINMELTKDKIILLNF